MAHLTVFLDTVFPMNYTEWNNRQYLTYESVFPISTVSGMHPALLQLIPLVVQALQIINEYPNYLVLPALFRKKESKKKKNKHLISHNNQKLIIYLHPCLVITVTSCDNGPAPFEFSA